MEEAKILHEVGLGLTGRQCAFSEDSTPAYMAPREDPLVVCARVRSTGSGATHWQAETTTPTGLCNQVEQVLPMLTGDLILDFHVKECAPIARAVVAPYEPIAGMFLARMAHTPTNAEHAVAVRYTFQQVQSWIERAFCLLVNMQYPHTMYATAAATATATAAVDYAQQTPASAAVLMGVD